MMNRLQTLLSNSTCVTAGRETVASGGGGYQPAVRREDPRVTIRAQGTAVQVDPRLTPG
jgi:hypothetical protein